MTRRGTPEADLQRAVVQALRLALPRKAIVHHCANEVTEAGPRSAKRLPAAGKSTRGGRITPGEWERRRGLRLRFVYRRTGPSLLVAEGRLNTKGQAVASRSRTGRGKVTAPIFLLVPQVKLPKRLDLARDAERAVDGVPGLIVANWVEGKLS